MSEFPQNYILVRGGGDLATGVIIRLWRVGMPVVVLEIAQPLAVRRLVAFSEAVRLEEFQVEEVTARLVDDLKDIPQVLTAKKIPVLVDPKARIIKTHPPLVMIDARMTKKPPSLEKDAVPLVIGLGPGFVPGVNCEAAIETKRGHSLGRVLWDSPPQPDTGRPGGIEGQYEGRVLRAQVDGVIRVYAKLGEVVQGGEDIGSIGKTKIKAPFTGLMRGMLYDGAHVVEGMKIGDVDPRINPNDAWLVSDKALAIGGAVLEAIFTFQPIQARLRGL